MHIPSSIKRVLCNFGVICWQRKWSFWGRLLTQTFTLFIVVDNIKLHRFAFLKEKKNF